MPVGMRCNAFGCRSESATVETFSLVRWPRSLRVSLSVPAAPHDGQAPNHCSALAPQSEQT